MYPKYARRYLDTCSDATWRYVGWLDIDDVDRRAVEGSNCKTWGMRNDLPAVVMGRGSATQVSGSCSRSLQAIGCRDAVQGLTTVDRSHRRASFELPAHPTDAKSAHFLTCLRMRHRSSTFAHALRSRQTFSSVSAALCDQRRRSTTRCRIEA